jgi:hypothetical protein
LYTVCNHSLFVFILIKIKFAGQVGKKPHNG